MIDPDLIVPLTLTILPIAFGFSLLIFFVARWEQKEKLNKTDKEPAKEPTETFDNDDDFELPLPDVVSARVIKKQS